jgi:hypothetical protein
MTERAAGTGGTAGFWSLVAAGVGIGGAGVWALAAAARAGVLRMLLEIFPKPTWESVTWGLIPALLLAPCVLQGAGVACLAAARPARIGRAVIGSLIGTCLAGGLIAAAVLLWVRRLPPPALAALTRDAPEVLVPFFAIVVLAGWLDIAARLPAARWLRRRTGLLAVLVVAFFWLRAHGRLMALSYVLDRPEMNVFFIAVALGGSAASAGAVRVSRRDS